MGDGPLRGSRGREGARRRSPDGRSPDVGRDGAAVVGLALATLAVCWPLGLTNRILAGVDAFTYFLPYWAYRMAELRAGHLPFWNPYLFLGAPFLANPQAAVLYPLHWPLSWLEPAQALVWSALLHLWLAAVFMYTFARRSLGLTRGGAWLAGILFGLGGFALAKIENINQLNALAWLPATLWLFEEVGRAGTRSKQTPALGAGARVGWCGALSLVIALQILAGHTQTVFINLSGLGLFAAWPMVREAVRQLGRLTTLRGKVEGSRLKVAGRRFLPALRRLLPLLAVLPAVLLAAAQLLPTLELNGLGLRTGGLTYRMAVSFSLQPRLLAQTLLPPLASDLAIAFGSEGYAEFVGYIGLTGVVLALLGMIRLRRRAAHPSTPLSSAQDSTPLCFPQEMPTSAQDAPHAAYNVAVGLAVLLVAGLLLALGGYDPIYYLLWRFVPGFNLFRAPARWLAWYAVGAAGLAGVGYDAWLSGTCEPIGGLWLRANVRTHRGPMAPCQRVNVRWWLLLAVLTAGFLIIQQLPSWHSVVGWVGVALLIAVLLLAGRRWPRPAAAGVLILALAELWLASRALPFSLATAPFAASLRNAPAALLSATADQPPAGRDRFLSMSDIGYDPGDLTELRMLQADRLPPEAIERLVRAAKQVEVIAPNLPLLWRLPAIDGYDGGVLPLAEYARLQSLFLPPEALLPDGRLREQLHAIPPDRLLDLTGVRFVITDKQRDLWVDDRYYDLEQTVLLQPGEVLTLDLAAYPPFSATALGVVAEGFAATGDDERETEADITVSDADGRSSRLSLVPSPQVGQPVVISLDVPMTPTTITVGVAAGAPAALGLRGLTLIDGRTGAHQSITLSPRGDLRRIHSGDVKVYERTAAPGRAWLVHGVQGVRDDDEALRLLADPGFEPRAAVILSADVPALAAQPAASGESVTVISYEPERIVLRASARAPAWLVLADAFYPGWEATVDGVPASIQRANLMFRAVPLPSGPGTHEVIFSYRPWSWALGRAISLATLVTVALGMTAALLLPALRNRRRRRLPERAL